MLLNDSRLFIAAVNEHHPRPGGASRETIIRSSFRAFPLGPLCARDNVTKSARTRFRHHSPVLVHQTQISGPADLTRKYNRKTHCVTSFRTVNVLAVTRYLTYQSNPESRFTKLIITRHFAFLTRTRGRISPPPCVS